MGIESIKDKAEDLLDKIPDEVKDKAKELATKENLKAARKNAAGTSKTAKEVKKAQNTQKALKTLSKKYKYGGNGGKDKDSLRTAVAKTKMTPAEQRAFDLIAEAADNKKNTKGKKNKDATSAIIKAATKAAKESLSKAKEANRVSVGKKNEKFYLPNVDLRGKADLSSNLKINTDALGSLMKPWQNASSQNVRTAAYVRPDAGRGDVLLGGANGAIDNSRAANTGFSDNLAAFRRV